MVTGDRFCRLVMYHCPSHVVNDGQQTGHLRTIQVNLSCNERYLREGLGDRYIGKWGVSPALVETRDIVEASHKG